MVGVVAYFIKRARIFGFFGEGAVLVVLLVSTAVKTE